MMDSLAYRNDAAIVLRRLIRSLPTRRGVIAVGTCDKGLPAMLLALAGIARPAGRAACPAASRCRPAAAEDAGTVQSIGARFAHGLVDVEYAADHGLPGLRLGRRRLPVPGHRRDLAGRRRGARA